MQVYGEDWGCKGMTRQKRDLNHGTSETVKSW